MSGLSETELGKKLVIVVRPKGSAPIVPPQPPQPEPDPNTPKPPQPEPPKPTGKKAGVVGDKLYIKVVDNSNKVVKKDGLFKFCLLYTSRCV